MGHLIAEWKCKTVKRRIAERLPGAKGLQPAQKIKKDFSKSRVAMLTGYDVSEYREAAVRYGADGFFVKDSVACDEVRALVKGLENDD